MTLPDNNIKTELSRRVFSFVPPTRGRVDRSCVDILKQYALSPEATARIVQALESFINCQTVGTDTPVIPNSTFAAAVHAVINFQPPVHWELSTPTTEAFFSHQLWTLLLTAAVDETPLRCNWEVLCQEGQRTNKGKMYADFGAYMDIDGSPYYTLLAEIERGAAKNAVHKDSVVLAVEMRLCLEWNIFKVTEEDINDLRMYGLLITQTSAEMLMMKPQYDMESKELTYVLKEDIAKFNFDPTLPPEQLIKEIVEFFAFIKMASDPETTGISRERIIKEGKRIDRKYHILLCFIIVK